jgi:hypothetical protein
MATPELRYVMAAEESDPSPFKEISPPREFMDVPVDPALLTWQGPRTIPETSVVVPKPLAAPAGMLSSEPAAPPPSVTAPPVDPHAPEDQPEQIVFEASSLIPPPFDASVFDHRVIGPPLVLKSTLAAERMLRFDLSTRELLAPETVMSAPAVRSLEAPVAVRATGPVALIAPVGETEVPVIVAPPALAVRVPAPE